MEDISSRWKTVYITGAISGILVIAAIIAAMVSGIVGSGVNQNVSCDALSLFNAMSERPFDVLYRLDFFNLLAQIFLVPLMFAVYAVLRRVNKSGAALAMLVFTVGAAIYIINNATLTFLDLNAKYQSVSTDMKPLYIAAAESVISRGVQGCAGALPGLVIPLIGNIIFSFAMRKGKFFSKFSIFSGVTGNLLLIFYFLMITIFPFAGEYGTYIAAPGGILVLIWIWNINSSLFRIIKKLSSE